MVPHVFGWFTMTSVWFILCAQLENAKRDIDEVSDNNIPEWVEATIYGSLLIFMNFAFVSCDASNLRNGPSLFPAALCCQTAPPIPVPCLADSNRLPTWRFSTQTPRTRPLSTLSLLFTSSPLRLQVSAPACTGVRARVQPPKPQCARMRPHRRPARRPSPAGTEISYCLLSLLAKLYLGWFLLINVIYVDGSVDETLRGNNEVRR